MDERQADVVFMDADLADAGADQAPAPGMVVAQSTPADHLHGIRGFVEDDIS